MAKEAVVDASKKPVKKNDKDKKEKVSFFKKITRFFKDLRSEVKKVVWPSKKQVKNNTIVVLGFMAVTAVFIWGVDFIFSTVMSLIFK